MRKATRIAQWLVVSILICLAATPSYYYVTSIRPTLRLAESTLKEARAEQPEPPDVLLELIRISQGDGLAFAVARTLALAPRDPVCPNGFGWHGCIVVLTKAFQWRFSERELLLLWHQLGRFGTVKQGARAGALERFGKTPSDLSVTQLAELVALNRVPLEQTQRVGARSQWLLEQLGREQASSKHHN